MATATISSKEIETIVKTNVQTVTLELTMDEASFLVTLLGYVSTITGPNESYDIYRSLHSKNVVPDHKYAPIECVQFKR